MVAVVFSKAPEKTESELLNDRPTRPKIINPLANLRAVYVAGAKTISLTVPGLI